MKRRVRHTGAWLLLLLFGSYYAGITLFPHVHTVGGHEIVHSHPYAESSTSSPEHSHTAAEFRFIQHLSFFLSLLVAAAGFLSSLPVVRSWLQLCRPAESCRPPDLAVNRLRGPPVALI